MTTYQILVLCFIVGFLGSTFVGLVVYAILAWKEGNEAYKKNQEAYERYMKELIENENKWKNG